TAPTGCLPRPRSLSRGRSARSSPQELSGPSEDLSLTAVRRPLERSLQREPPDLLHLVVAIVHVTADVPHQEEVDPFADPDVLPDVDVLRVAEVRDRKSTRLN